MVFTERCSESAPGLEEHWYASLRNPVHVRGDSVLGNVPDAGHDFQILSNVGIDVDAITPKLQVDG